MSGVLTNLAANTVGGVIEAGSVVAEIVPGATPLEAEVRVLPADVTSIYQNQPAKVVITAFNARLEDPLVGKVNYVSADSQIDPNTGEAYFTARVSLDPDQGIKSQLLSGMYAQVFITTEARSFMSYMLQPITDSFRKAFREK